MDVLTPPKFILSRTLKEEKFKAIIREKNAVIIFTLKTLSNPKPLFSIRTLLLPWLRKGNYPRKFSGLITDGGEELYDLDIVNLREPEIWYPRLILNDRTDWYLVPIVQNGKKQSGVMNLSVQILADYPKTKIVGIYL